MDQWIIFILGVIFSLVVTIIATRITEYLKERRQVLIEDKTSKLLAQTPEDAPGNLKLIYKGIRVKAFYDNEFLISNQAFDSMNKVELSILVNPPNAFLDYKLVDKERNRTCKIERIGNEIKIFIPYLNSQKGFEDALGLHIYSELEIDYINVQGSGPGWKAVYKGRATQKESVVSPTSGAYVCIEGPIGVGKTTLANLLQQEWSSKILYEEFEENPFLTDFYKDRGGFAFQTQIFFLLSRYSQLSGVEMEGFPLVADYMFAKDRIFAQLNLYGDELHTYLRGYEAFNEHLPTPDLVIYLTADLDCLMERIKNRGRGYEKEIKPEYIAELSYLYDEFFSNYESAPVYKLDITSLDIVNNLVDQKTVLKLIESALGHS